MSSILNIYVDEIEQLNQELIQDKLESNHDIVDIMRDILDNMKIE